jgi:23S rRNA (cytidine1920-2'-O)/16S rRNA (cytidine1409-2'-O)-methyltransferase
MVRRGLAATRSEADVAIRTGRVIVAGRTATKAGTLVAPADPITLAASGRRFASRGGEKLESALDAFRVEVAGRRALDAGASTGGFTDCLLSRGAEHVVAVDVGYGQLDWRLRTDPRVTVLERTNVRDLDPAALPYLADVVVADLSFISLALVLPALVEASAQEAEFVLLVKPQFEAGRADVGRGGVVSDPNVWTRVLSSVWDRLLGLGVRPAAVMASPLVGPAGNVEFLVYGRRDERAGIEPNTGDIDAADTIRAAVDEGVRLRAGPSRGEGT